jgi:hypothetical protein
MPATKVSGTKGSGTKVLVTNANKRPAKSETGSGAQMLLNEAKCEAVAKRKLAETKLQCEAQILRNLQRM